MACAFCVRCAVALCDVEGECVGAATAIDTIDFRASARCCKINGEHHMRTTHDKHMRPGGGESVVYSDNGRVF